MRAKAITTAGDFGLQESADQPHQPTLPTLFDTFSHHDWRHETGLPDVEAWMHEPGIMRANSPFGIRSEQAGRYGRCRYRDRRVVGSCCGPAG
jgi:hypothetical protein